MNVPGLPRHGRLPSEAEQIDATEIFYALHDLPPAPREQVDRRMAEVAAGYAATGQVDPVLRFVRSLLATARLHRNRHYVKALAEADLHPEVPSESAMDPAALERRFAEFKRSRAAG